MRRISTAVRRYCPLKASFVVAHPLGKCTSQSRRTANKQTRGSLITIVQCSKFSRAVRPIVIVHNGTALAELLAQRVLARGGRPVELKQAVFGRDQRRT